MKLRAKINNQQDLRIRSSITAREINGMDDIDVSGLADGSVLVYSTANSKWEATNLLEKQTVECGQY